MDPVSGPHSGLVIGGKYRLGRRIGGGTHGHVYDGVDIGSGKKVAVKVERKKHSLCMIDEVNAYRAVDGLVGFARVYWVGQTDDDDKLYIVTDLLGPSLWDLFDACGRRFSLKTILLLADQILTRIENLHSRGYIHMSIKAENFAIGVDKDKDTVFLIDFGRTTRFNRCTGRTSRDGDYITYGRSDDLEALGFMMTFFLTGYVPWLGDTAQWWKTASDQEKMQTLDVQLQQCPEEFTTYIAYCRQLQFHETPDYRRMRLFFRCLFFESGFSDDDRQFDWCALKQTGSAAENNGENSTPGLTNICEKVKQTDNNSATLTKGENSIPQSVNIHEKVEHSNCDKYIENGQHSIDNCRVAPTLSDENLGLPKPTEINWFDNVVDWLMKSANECDLEPFEEQFVECATADGDSIEKLVCEIGEKPKEQPSELVEIAIQVSENNSERSEGDNGEKQSDLAINAYQLDNFGGDVVSSLRRHSSMEKLFSEYGSDCDCSACLTGVVLFEKWSAKQEPKSVVSWERHWEQ